MKLLSAILLFIAALSACRSTRHLPVITNTAVRDSIVERYDTVIRKDTITLPGEIIEIEIPCPGSTVNEYEGGERSSLKAVSDGKGKVKITCKADSLQKVIDGLKTIINAKEKFHNSKEVQQVPYPVEVVKYKIPKWVWWLMLYTVASLAWKFRRPILALFKITV